MVLRRAIISVNDTHPKALSLLTFELRSGSLNFSKDSDGLRPVSKVREGTEDAVDATSSTGDSDPSDTVVTEYEEALRSESATLTVSSMPRPTFSAA